MKCVNLVLLGPPGAGKGTQAVILAKAYNLTHISTGDMLREEIKTGTEFGRLLQTYMDKGELVPDDIVTQAVISRMRKPDVKKGVILDGYPRTKAQAESLQDALSKENRSLDIVLYFRTSKTVAVERLSGRRVCPKCGQNYHIKNIPPKREGLCDTCKVELIQRKDDTRETVINRLRVYEELTKDLISYYKDKGLLQEVDGDLSANALFDKLTGLFHKRGLI